MIQPTDAEIREILLRSRVIALIGASLRPERPSNYVGAFLKEAGKTVLPVNPGHAGKTLFGEVIRASIADIPADANVDMVVIFRRAENVPMIVSQAVAHFPRLETIWMQLGIAHPQSAQMARAKGLTVVQNRCTKTEYSRLVDAR